MFRVTLGDKTYEVPYVTAKALLHITPALEVVKRAQEGEPGTGFEKDLETLVNWFCLMCGDQFKAADVYELYPADRIVADLVQAVLAVSGRVSYLLKEFPTTAAAARTAETANA